MSKRCEYALRALVALALGSRSGSSPVSLNHLSEGERIPAGFLEQILRQLKEAGYVKSSRGKVGGYELARDAQSVRIGDVVRLIDGPLAPIRCVSRTAYERCSCPDEASCGLRVVMERVRNSIAEILDGTSLASVAETVAPCAVLSNIQALVTLSSAASGLDTKVMEKIS